jgi:hypothetical protein
MHTIRVFPAVLLLSALDFTAAPAVAGGLPFHIGASAGRTEIGDIDGFPATCELEDSLERIRSRFAGRSAEASQFVQ